MASSSDPSPPPSPRPAPTTSSPACPPQAPRSRSKTFTPASSPKPNAAVRALDTNVVVRFLTGDDPGQSARARAIIGREPVFIPRTVILETEWVLRAVYDLSPARIIPALRALAGLPDVTVEDAPHRPSPRLGRHRPRPRRRPPPRRRRRLRRLSHLRQTPRPLTPTGRPTTARPLTRRGQNSSHFLDEPLPLRLARNDARDRNPGCSSSSPSPSSSPPARPWHRRDPPRPARRHHPALLPARPVPRSRHRPIAATLLHIVGAH